MHGSKGWEDRSWPWPCKNVQEWQSLYKHVSLFSLCLEVARIACVWWNSAMNSRQLSPMLAATREWSGVQRIVSGKLKITAPEQDKRYKILK
jgi:hypothetical protein